MNALRHGLTGQFYVMNEADRIAYEAFEKEILADLAPVGAVERQYAVAIAQDNWRLNRARAIEFNIEGLGDHECADAVESDSPEVTSAVVQAKTWLKQHHALTNLALYESRIERQLNRIEKRLEVLQKVRKAKEAQALEEAELLLAQALMRKNAAELSAPHVSNGAATSGLIPTSVMDLDTIQVNGFEFSNAKILAGLNRKTDLATARFYKSNGWDATKPLPKALTMPMAA